MQKELKSIIASFIIGNGYIVSNRKQNGQIFPHLRMRHSIKQKDYLRWKTSILEANSLMQRKGFAFNIKNEVTSLKNKKFFQIVAMLNKSSFLRKLYKKYYTNYKKDVEKLLSCMIDARSIAIWFMDDGSANKRKRKHKDGTVYYLSPSITLCTHSFSYEENVKIKNWFRDNFNIEGRIGKNVRKKTYYFLDFNVENAKKIWKLIKPYVNQIESMKKKFLICNKFYSDSE